MRAHLFNQIIAGDLNMILHLTRVKDVKGHCRSPKYSYTAAFENSVPGNVWYF